MKMETLCECDSAQDVGKLINMISHQLKRQSSFPETESGLTGETWMIVIVRE